MISVDTNVLLRYLLEPLDSANPNWQLELARNTIEASDCVYISDVVLAETEWVLESVFELTRNEILTLLRALSSNALFQFDDWTALQRALLDYHENLRVDFSDCLIARRANAAGAFTLYTFESSKKLGGLNIATTLSKPVS